MALILPSEIARLVFGYLEENECTEAASKFFTTSPHLEECRYVSQKGRKFDTKVNDHTLTDIVEKYFLVMRFVKEKLSKMEDSDFQSTDLMVMVKLLLDGPPRGKQRFVVNINVPPPQTGGSPILAGSSRKRRLHSHQHADRPKRPFRLDPDKEKSEGSVSNQQVNTDATQLNQLPGHSEPGQEPGLIKSLTDIQSLSTEIKIKETIVEVHKESKLQPMKNSTATDTKELMCYATAEVQTQDDHVESDTELASDMPIENLSLLTREMLSRTEIQEKIAEQINKAGLPNLSSVIKETSFCDNPEVNTSIMSELNNAIKSVVTTTEKDPVFEDFLNEIIGTTDESPDGSPYDSNPTERFNPEVKTEPPNTVEETDIKEGIFNLNEPTHDLLFDDLNAAAIQGIINVNKITRETGDLTEAMKKEENPTSTAVTLGNETEIPSVSPATVLSIDIPNLPVNVNPVNLNLVNVNPVNFNPPVLPTVSSSILTTVPKTIQKVSKATIRKGKPRKAPRPESAKIKPKIVSNEEVVTTLVFCQQDQENEEAHSIRMTSGNNQCLAIMPKLPGETLFLRTVQVPKKIPAPPAPPDPPALPPPPPPPPPSPPLDLPQFKRIAPKISSLPNLLVEPVEKKKNDQEDEAITLYRNNLESFPVGTEIPILTADDSISCSGTGLSPFLKLNKRKRSPAAPGPPAPPPVPPVEALPTVDLTGDTSFVLEKEESIIKRTPKSLLKSRAKNHRLSLSTPRRRSSHVRALDFNTPTGLSSSRRYSVTSTRASPSRPLNKSIPRSSLFSTPIKSPRKKAPVKTPVRSLKPLETPIATRSPAPTLQGNWNKVSGVDTIIGCDSQSDSGSPPKKRPKSWDADLREGLVIPEESPNKPRRNSNKLLKNDKEEVNNDPVTPTIKSEVEVESKEAKSSEKVAQSTIVTAKGVTKKYAKLKTITSKISGSSDLSSNFETSTTEKVIKDLETPRKSEDIGVPPTPRILSPSSNQCSFVRINSNETKVTGFVTTPEFPVTPCINFTPKHGDNTVDSLKKDFALYYHPGVYGKPVNNVDVKESNSNANAAASTSASTSASTETVANTLGAKLEITQFEVIKENLPKEETCKELRISNAEGLNKSQESEKSLENSRSDDSDSDSDSSSSSSSSSSSYCSDDQSKSRSRLSVSKTSNVLKKSDNLGLDLSDSMIKTDDKSLKDDNKQENCEDKVSQQDGGLVLESSGEQEGGLVEKGGETDGGKIQIEKEEEVCGTIQSEKSVEDLSVEKEKVVEEAEEISDEDQVEEGEIIEASPKKMFPIVKSDKALAEADIETPAKNDDLLDEADISETPSGSKNGTETTTTNLTTKISKIINTNSQWPQEDKVMKSTLIESKNNNDVLPGPSQPENSEVNHEILRRELDEKRLRIMDRLKKNITVKPMYGGSKGKNKNDKAKPRNNVVVNSKAQESNEVKESVCENHEAKDKDHGNLEVKDRTHGNLEMNDRIHENLEVRDRGYGNLELRDRGYGNLEVRDRGYGNLEAKDRGYGNLEVRDRTYGSLEVRDRGYGNNYDPRYRIHGNHYEGNDRNYRGNDPRDRIYGNNYEGNKRDYRSNDPRDRTYGDHYEGNERGYRNNDPRDKSNETRGRHRSNDRRGRSRGSNERRSKSHGSDEGKGRSHGSNEDRGRNHRSNEDRVKSHESNEDKGRSHEDKGKNYRSTDDKGRSRGNNEGKDRRDDKARNQRTDYDKDKKDDKIRNERLNHEIQPTREDKVKNKINADTGGLEKEDKTKINTVTSEVQNSKNDKVRSQVADDKKDVKEEKSEQVKNKVKGQGTEEAKKEEIDKNNDGRREVKLPVIPVTRKSARYAARAAKNEAEKIKRDSSKDKDKKKSVEDNRKSKIEVEKTNLPSGKILDSILTGKLLLKEVVDRAKLDQAKSNEVSKKDDKANMDKKMKVDAVKRDLFSGDEMSDVETKKVTSSQVEDLMMQLHKSNTPEVPETEEVSDKNMVLESLNLQPTSKSSSESEADLSMNYCEIKFVHDDNVNSKKRYRKTTLDVVPITIPTEDGGTMTVILTLTSHEELFNLQPARVKKITKKDPPKPAPEPVRYRRKVQLKDSKPMVTSIDSLPLATSSPLTMELPGTSKVVKPELTKSTSTNQVQKKKDQGDKINNEAKGKNSVGIPNLSPIW
ncbi:titin homolog [Cotesia glomerata]|uniref:LisH domain-containing protein n=1 Tax=Cotesia glomerata TaxID=32391 RepID=A0AAV7IIE3_COTGL|nr:titin homolog [Cotesia glomerata]KAH0552287.1 hypothetical protein KQX54_008317 [Cotesia glomerata]